MNFYQNFGYLVKESIKLLLRNGKLMFLVVTLSLLLSSIFYIIFDFSSFSLMRDMLAKESLIPISSANSAEFSTLLAGVKENFPHLLTIYFAFVLSYFIVTFLPTIATVVVSSEGYNSKNVSLKEMSLKIVTTWKRLLITGFYTTILVIGFVFLVISLATPLLMSSDMSILGLAIPFGIVAYIFYLYMSSVWIMSLVVSVVEEICGAEALGRSGEILKNRRILGFVLNILLNLVSLGIYLGSKMIKGGKFGMSEEKICGLFVVNCSCLVRIFTYMVYNVLYCQRKDSREIELNWSNVEYDNLSVKVVNGLP